MAADVMMPMVADLADLANMAAMTPHMKGRTLTVPLFLVRLI